MSETIYLTKADAAAACGCKEVTIQRYKRDGKLPNACYGPGGKLELGVALEIRPHRHCLRACWAAH